MIRWLSAGLVALTLAACGVDGEPQQPATGDGSPGVRVTGDARIGMSVGESGARGYGSFGVTNGPISLRVGY